MSNEFKILSGHLGNNKGMALVTVLIVSTVLAAAGSAFLSGGSQEAGLVNDQAGSGQALYAAESGVQYACNNLRASMTNWTNPSSWVNNLTPNWDNKTTTVGFTYNAGNSPPGVITSTGIYQGHSRTITVGVTPQINTPLTNAACGCSGLNFGGNSVVVNGDVGSNGNINLGGANVTGNAVATGNLSGQNGSVVTGTATLGGDASSMSGTVAGGITANVSPAPSPCNCNAVDVPTDTANAAASNNNGSISGAYLDGTDFSIDGSDSVTLAGGTYYFTSFTIAGTASVNVAEGAQVIIYLDGDDGSFSFGGTGIVNNANNSANDLWIYSNSTADITLSGTSDFTGVLYATEADIKINGTNTTTGALIGNVSIMQGNVTFNYDPSLGGQAPPGSARVTIVTNSWSQ